MKKREAVLSRYCQSGFQTRLDLYMEHRDMRGLFDRIHANSEKGGGVPEPLTSNLIARSRVEPNRPCRRFLRWCCSLVV